MSYLPSIFSPHLTQFSPHSPLHLTQDLELEWVSILADSNPAFNLFTDACILSARYLLSQLPRLQDTSQPSKYLSYLPTDAFYEDGRMLTLSATGGLCVNLPNIANTLGKEKLEEMQACLEHCFLSIFGSCSSPFNTCDTELPYRGASEWSYFGEVAYVGTLYKNPLRIAFLELIALQPLEISSI